MSAAFLLPLPAAGQMVPMGCTGKTGEALDKCVRDITPVEPPRIVAKEAAPDPRVAESIKTIFGKVNNVMNTSAGQ